VSWRAGALAVLILVGGCGGGDEPAPRPTATPAAPVERVEPTPEEAIAALLERRAAALEAGDSWAYAATATAARRRADRVHARRAARLRPSEVKLVPLKVDVQGNRATARVVTSYGLAGVRSEFRVERRMTFRRRGEWRVAAVRARRGAPPWEIGDFVRRGTHHFVILAPAPLDVGDLPTVLESGYGAMRELLAGSRLRRGYLVLVTADAAQAGALTTRIQGVETLAAISDATIVQSGPAAEVDRVVGLRLLVVWQSFGLLGPDERERVVTHELTHAALAGTTSGRTPSWLSEGVALYVSGDRRAAPPGADLTALSRPHDIGRLSGAAQSDAYAASSAAAFAIAERFGRRRLLRLHDVFNDPSLRGRPGPRLADRAVRRVLGVRLDEILS
jgi:hypothetical protein